MSLSSPTTQARENSPGAGASRAMLEIFFGSISFRPISASRRCTWLSSRRFSSDLRAVWTRCAAATTDDAKIAARISCFVGLRPSRTQGNLFGSRMRAMTSRIRSARFGSLRSLSSEPVLDHVLIASDIGGAQILQREQVLVAMRLDKFRIDRFAQ
jgi:hypothetical protein